MKALHLVAALLALVLVGLAVLGGHWYVRSLERQYIHALAPLKFNQKSMSSALEQEAFAQPDLLVLYGSSEVPQFGIFKKYPTGFNVFRLGGPGDDSLIYLQALAGVGSELKGKRVVISFTPGQFYFPEGLNPDYYAGNFSRLHAYDVAFSTDLSLGLKQAVAKRMLDFPKALATDNLLRFALERLADGSPISLALYYASMPLGKFQSLVLNLQDDWEMYNFIRQQKNLDPVAEHTATSLDWAGMESAGEREAQSQTTNNPFGFENSYWNENAKALIQAKGSETDGTFRKREETAKGWQDLSLLLRTLHELGAQTLILSTPEPGQYYEYMGVSTQGSLAYYQKLETLAKSYDATVVDFAGHNLDKYFLSDRWSHPSAEGVIYFEQALDDFYHNRFVPPGFTHSSSPSTTVMGH